MANPIDGLARCLTLGTLLHAMTRRFGGYEIVARWTLNEHHHDVVVLLPTSAKVDLPGRVLVVATTGESDIKEVICFAEVPDRNALWHQRCPEAPEFSGKLAPMLARATTQHWVEPRELLGRSLPPPRQEDEKRARGAADVPPTQRSR